MTNKIQYHKRRQVFKVDTDLAFCINLHATKNIAFDIEPDA